AARQQDRLGHPHHPPAHRHRGRMPGRTQPAQEPRARAVAIESAPPRHATRRAGGDAGRHAQAAGRFRRSQPAHPHLQLPAGPRHRPSHQPDPAPASRNHRRRSRRPGRRAVAGGARRGAQPARGARMSGKTASVLATRIIERLERGDAAGAETQARQFREAVPDDGELARLHGIALLMLGRAPEARVALADAVRLAPDNFLARCNYAAALMDAGVRNNLANALRASGDDARAREQYLAAIAASPGHLGATLNLAAVELSLGMLFDAERRLRVLLSAQAHPQAWLLLGNVLHRRGKFADAQAAYLQGAHLAPGAAEFPYQAALMADEQGHYAEAVGYYRRAL